MSKNLKQIAVIGQACRFPGGADSPDAFWKLLLSATDAVTHVPEDRFDQRRFWNPDPGVKGRSYTFAAGTIGDISGFDAAFFGISAREAQQMDPQQRLLLELTYEALECAGQVPSRIAGSDCAVYVGISGSDYAERRMGDLETTESYFMLGATLSIAANRISYIFDLHGPSMAIDTACSSSLVALHEAVQALLAGRAGMAVVGGVNLLLSPAPFIGFSKAMMLARDGRCRAFGKGGDGYVRAEGGGVLILKPLAEAERDGDPILAVIRGVGVNTDGRTHGLALPSRASQENLLKKIYREARVSPRAVSYFEAHGTGTAVGDPTEAAAIGGAIGKRRPKTAPLLIGSVKTNIGHLEPAAGMAGLIKAIQVVRHGVIPPSLHAAELNPDIPFDALNLRVARTATPLPQPEGRQIVGINSFGFGGTNAHAVLEAYQQPKDAGGASADEKLPLVLSARSSEALRALAQTMLAHLLDAQPSDWRDIAYTTACRRSHYEHRLILRATNLEAAKIELAAIAARALPGPTLGRSPKTALVFVGNGSQWLGMGTKLLEEDSEFRDAIAQVDAVARWRLGWSLIQAMQSGHAALDDTSIAQPLLFALQVALVKSLQARGLEFDGTIGHSVGEVAAAHIAGALTLEQAVNVIAKRSEAQAMTRGQGRMLAVALGEAAAQGEIAPFAGLMEIAAVNSPRAVTLSGDSEAIAALADDFARRGIAAKPLDLDYAFHSSSQEPTRDGLLGALSDLRPAPARIDFYSTVTGGALPGTDLTAVYWWRNIRECVRFADAVAAMEEDGYRVFLEIGPNALLQGNLRQTLTRGRPLAVLTPTHDGAAALDQALDAVWLMGASLAFEKLFTPAGRTVALPSYPWQRERHAYEPTPEQGTAFTTRQEGPLLGTRLAPQISTWENLFDVGSLPFLAGHCVAGSVIVPAAAFVEMALEAGSLVHGDVPLEIEGLEIQRALVLDTPRMVRFTLGDSGFFRIESREHMRKSAWNPHVTGRLAALSQMPDTILPAPGEDAIAVSRDDHYSFARAQGFGYGGDFDVLQDVLADAAAATASLKSLGGGYRLHPALVDGVLQAIFPVLRRHCVAGETCLFVPHKIARIFFRPTQSENWQAEAVLKDVGNRSVTMDGVLRSADKASVLVLQNVRLTRVPEHDRATTQTAVFEMPMEPLPSLAPVPVPQAGQAADRVFAEAVVTGGDAALLDRLAVAFAADALLALGEAGPADPVLLTRLIAMVESHDGDIGEPDEMWRAAITTHSHLVTELTVLGYAGRGLAMRLRGGATARPSVMREQLFEAPVLAAGYRILAQATAAFVKSWPEARRLRVLIVGASPELLAVLPHADITVFEPDAEKGPALEARFGTQATVTSTAESAFDLIVAAYVDLPGTLTQGSCSHLLMAAAAPSPWTQLVLESSVGAAPTWQKRERRVTGGLELISACAADIPEAPSSPAKDWLILTGAREAALANALAGALAALGQRATIHDALQPLPANGSLSLVHLAGIYEPALEDQARRCDQLVTLLRDAGITELVLVTDRALPLEGETNPAAAALIGMGRVLQNERPQITCRILDLHGADCAVLAAEIAQGLEPQVALTREGRFAPRLRRVAATAPPLPPGMAEVLQTRGGGLDNLHWARVARRDLAADEVEIAVEAAGLNFRDVMFALGVLPDDILEGGFAGATLGMEAAGIVSRVGSGVENVVPGDKVVCFAPASLSSHLVTRAFAVAALPEGFDFAQGATVTAAFFTVTYALAHLAQLRQGERILIHGAAGGVGIAALQYARHAGAEVFATAGSDEKREFVRLTGIADDHVLDSRSLDFAAQIRALTDGEGVDVVLNSLAGEAVHRGLSLLRPFGRFIELGKVDFVANSRIGLRAFRNNIAYHGVDADQLMAARPDLAGAVFRQTMALFAGGVYAPLPYRRFARNEMVEGFRHMQRARHIGKIVIDVAPPPPVPAASAAPPVVIHPEATYLITGGTAGFGLASAQWLAARGARHLVLTSRAPKECEEIENLRGAGVRVDLCACDIRDAAAVTALVGEFAGTLKGVIHAAAIYDDGLAAELTPERLRNVLSPKAGGALALDKATRGLSLDLFLLYSSISAVIGNPGQANYAAANLVLESLAARRRAQGLAAQIVALAPVAATGQMERQENLAGMFQKIGVRPLAAAEIFARLDEIILGGTPGFLIADVKWSRLRTALPALRSGTFRMLAGNPGQDDSVSADADFAALAETLAPEEFLALLLSGLCQAVGHILQVPAEKLDREASIFDLGMDSLMGLELRMSIEEKFGIAMPSMALAQDASLHRLAVLIRDELTGTSIRTSSDDLSPEREQAHILSRHAENISPEAIAQAMESVRGGQRVRLIP